MHPCYQQFTDNLIVLQGGNGDKGLQKHVGADFVGRLLLKHLIYHLWFLGG